MFASQWDYYSQDSSGCLLYKSPEALRLFEAISDVYFVMRFLKYLNIIQRKQALKCVILNRSSNIFVICYFKGFPYSSKNDLK